MTESSPINELPSPNYDARPGGIDMLILHYTGMKSAQEAIDRLRDPAAKVSSHYVVDEAGTVFRLVAEEHRAYHAGISVWRGRNALNDVSIGIEIVNPGHQWGYRPFPAAQIEAVEALCAGIVARHAIAPIRVVGHSDVAPDRKQDPGELFPWQALARSSIGFWPETVPPHVPEGLAVDLQPGARADACAALVAIGYDAPDTDEALATTLCAFQRHWRQEAVTGTLDRGTFERLLALQQALASC